jgi:Fic family protein
MLKPLPPETKLRFDSETMTLLSGAETLLYQLSGVLSLFSEDHFITRTLHIREASNSLAIDNYSVSIEEYFTKLCTEENHSINTLNNYLRASSVGLRLIKDVSHAGHIIKSLYTELAQESSKSQLNELYRGRIVNSAEMDNKFVLPPTDEIPSLIEKFENYIESDVSYPPLVNAALIHAQFELIHPFEYFNGLTGRILIQLHLNWKKRVANNCLQISGGLLKRKEEYFNRLKLLTANENWNEWIKFFLSIIISSANETNEIIKTLFRLEQTGYEKIIRSGYATSTIFQLYKHIFDQPVITIPHITKTLSLTKQTANIVVSRLLELDLLSEVTGKQRYRMYVNKNFLDAVGL